MKIGIAGPISTASVASLLRAQSGSVPVGRQGAPLLGTLITSLVERGHQVSAYTLDLDLPVTLTEPIMVDGTKGFRIYYGPYRRHSFRPNGWVRGRMMDFFAVERRFLRDAIKRDAPDVVHAHWAYEYAMAVQESGLPHVVTCHDSPRQVLRYMPNPYRAGRYMMARRVMRKARLVTAVSPYLKEEVQRHCTVPVQVIGNPVPAEIFAKASSRSSVNQSGPRIAAILNGWSKIKNPEITIEAFSILKRKLGCASLHLFGSDFGAGEKAHVWAMAKNMADGIVFHGVTPHARLLQALQDVDILLHTAREEACPLALIEAMAIGVPVVGGDRSGGVPWVLGGGEAGVLTNINSTQAVCASILTLIDNPRLYAQKARAGLDRAVALFSPHNIAAQYEAIYNQAVSGGRTD